MNDQTKSDSVEKIADTLRGIVGQRAGVLSMSLVADLQLIESRLRALPTSATAQEAVSWNVEEDSENNRIRFTIGVQRFTIDWMPDGEEDESRRPWMASMLRMALAKLAAPPPQPVSETAAQGSVEFGEALDELIRANTAADADDRFGVERERRARANVERLYALAAAPSAPLTPEAAAAELTREAERLGMYDAQSTTRE